MSLVFVDQARNSNIAAMKNEMKIAMIVAMMMLLLIVFMAALNHIVKAENENGIIWKDHESVECIVIDHIGDHDVKLVDGNNNIWTLIVEDVRDSAYIKGTVIFIKVP